MSTTTAQPAIGFIGLGDQGLPMATAIAEAGYSLHVWARRPGSLAALGTIAHGRRTPPGGDAVRAAQVDGLSA
jgi:3-hydroxyisobutyrate dehydrogenase-like beta-hydroxyacid dehydrogenase